MSNDYKYSLYRINMLLTLFRSEYAIYTISELANMLEVPKNVIREDIYLLSRGVDECETVIFPYDDEDGDEDEFLTRLKKGLEDDTPLGAYSRFKAELFLPMTRSELGVLDDFYPEKQFGQRFSKDGTYIKSSPYREDTKTLFKLAQLNDYIDSGCTLNINYCAKDGSVTSIDFKPLCIVRYNLENVSYVVSCKNGELFPLRVDKIISMKPSQKEITITDYSPLKKIPLMWKMDMGEETFVRIKIAAPKRIRDKIKNDIFSMRISYESVESSSLKDIIDLEQSNDSGEWIDEDDSAYYSGKIVGMSAFKNWVNGYGSSIEVLEPESLRRDIIESARKRCKKYSEQ